MITTSESLESPIYQGQFGEFTITEDDRREVIIYRCGLVGAALSFFVGAGLILFLGVTPLILQMITVLFLSFSLSLGVSLLTIHIYLKPLHRALQVFWLIGSLTGIFFTITNSEPLALFVYTHPLSLFGIGFTFAALTGIYFKEAFCFDRLETKLLTPLVPILLLGHLTGILPLQMERGMLMTWAFLFLIFAGRKIVQAIPPDIGDKSVFEHLKAEQKLRNS